PPTCAAGDALDALVCRSLPTTGVAGDLYVAVKPGWFFDPDIVVGKGSSHGSSSLENRSVPFVVRAPGRAPAAKVVAEPLPPSSLTVTAAHLLGAPPPPAARGGRDLSR